MCVVLSRAKNLKPPGRDRVFSLDESVISNSGIHHRDFDPSGGDNLTGTPFDKAINTITAAESSEKAHLPFVTMPRAQHGRNIDL